MAEIIEFDPQAEPKCSFCGKRKSEVPKLICGEGEDYICTSCVAKCTELMGKK